MTAMPTSPMRTLDQTLAAIDAVDGWLTTGQAGELYHAARATRSGERIVEIGSFRGRSTIVLANAAPPGVAVIAIDPHAGNDRGPQELHGYATAARDDHQRFVANLAAAGVEDRVRHVRAFSTEAHAAVDGDVAVLYIDGAHRYGPARTDIRDWGARVAPGGRLLIHDAFSSVGVTLAIARELLLGRRFRFEHRSRSLAVYRADLDGSWRARAANAARQLASLPWFVRNVMLKALLTARLGGLLRRVTGCEPQWPY